MAPPPAPRPFPWCHRRRFGTAGILVLAAMALGAGIGTRPAHAQQGLAFPPRPAPPARPPVRAGADQQMLVRADQIDYDYTNNRVSAVGNVQIYYSG